MEDPAEDPATAKLRASLKRLKGKLMDVNQLIAQFSQVKQEKLAQEEEMATLRQEKQAFQKRLGALQTALEAQTAGAAIQQRLNKAEETNRRQAADLASVQQRVKGRLMACHSSGLTLQVSGWLCTRDEPLDRSQAKEGCCVAMRPGRRHHRFCGFHAPRCSDRTRTWRRLRGGCGWPSGSGRRPPSPAPTTPRRSGSRPCSQSCRPSSLPRCRPRRRRRASLAGPSSRPSAATGWAQRCSSCAPPPTSPAISRHSCHIPPVMPSPAISRHLP